MVMRDRHRGTTMTRFTCGHTRVARPSSSTKSFFTMARCAAQTDGSTMSPVHRLLSSASSHHHHPHRFVQKHVGSWRTRVDATCSMSKCRLLGPLVFMFPVGFFFTQGDGTRICNGRHFITTFFLPCRPGQWKHLFGPWPLSHASSVGAVIGESVARKKKKEHCKSGTSESPYLGSLNPTRRTNAVDGRLAQKATS